MHQSVLLEESLAPLIARAGSLYLDCTFGGGGHTAWILKNLPNARVVALDKDKAMIDRAKKIFSEEIGSSRLVLVHSDYSQAAAVLSGLGLSGVDGLIADLGVSSFQLDIPDRGFSFQRKGPLDMRMNQAQQLSAQEIVNRWPAPELERIFFTFGEEKYTKKIVRKIVEERDKGDITDTETLAAIIKEVVPRQWEQKIHPATRVFQALRIVVNGELENLEILLNSIPDILDPKGVAAIISFHSLEDRMVKQRFRYLSADCICPPEIMTCDRCHKPPGHIFGTKPVVPSESEQINNPRARSAKLRIFSKNG